MFTLLISLIDFLTLTFARFKRAARVTRFTPDNADFTILIPIFGDISYLKNTEFLKEYGAHVILCTTSKETPEFNAALREVAGRYGFRIFRSDVVRHTSKSKPNPWRLFTNTLHSRQAAPRRISDAARDEIIRDSFAMVDTSYCVFLDADTTTNGSLYQLVGLMRQHNYDVASVRVLVAEPKTIMERLQAIEYRFAMEARKVYPWLTSGACMVAKTSTIKDIMANHSLFFSGGDIEVGKLAKMLGKRVGHLAFDFETAAPKTFRGWFKQRMAWFGGGFRHAIINAGTYTWRHPLYFLYFTVIVYMMWAVRWYEVISHPELIPFVIALYWVLLFTFRWEDRSWLFFIFPMYALIQVMVLVFLGPMRYLHMAYHSRNLGFIRLRAKTRKGPDSIPAPRPVAVRPRAMGQQRIVLMR